MLNARRRHDRLLRQYLVVARERAEAQLAGSSSSRIERLGVRERTLAAAVRNVRLHLGMSGTFDPDLESARLGIDGKRPTPSGRRAAAAPIETVLRPRIRPVPRSTGAGGEPAQRPPRIDVSPRVLTVGELLDFISSRSIDADASIVVRARSGEEDDDVGDVVPVGGHCAVEAIELLVDGRVQLDTR